MIQLFTRVTVALVLAVFAGCTTMRALDQASPTAIREAVEPGDRIRVAATNGKVYEVKVTRVEADSLSGTADNGKRYKIPFAAVDTLEVQQGSVLKTLGVGVGTAAVVGTVVLAIALHDLDIHFGICE